MGAMLMMFATFIFIGGNIFSMAMEGEQAFVSTKLNGAITSTALFIQIDSADGLPTSVERGFIGDEEIRWDSIQTSNDANCAAQPCLVLTSDDRGLQGTDADSHPDDTRVYTESAGLLNQAVAFKVGNTDSVVGKIAIPFQATWSLVKFFAKMLMWDWSFWEGDAFWFKLFLLYPISGAVMLGLLALLRGPVERLLPI